jgi:hypothetical protein
MKTDELMSDLLIAQLLTTRDLIDNFLKNNATDDDYDAMSAALTTSDQLLWAHYDRDSDAGVQLFESVINPTDRDDRASDGLCDELNTLRQGGVS